MPQALPVAVYYIFESIEGLEAYAAFAAAVTSYSVNRYEALAAARDARDQFNAAQKERLTSVSLVDAPRSRIYGRVRNVDGILFKGTYGDKTQYLQMVVALAAHEVDAIETVYFGDSPLTLDVSGYVQSQPWNKGGRDTYTKTVVLDGSGNGSFTPSTGFWGANKVLVNTSVAAFTNYDAGGIDGVYGTPVATSVDDTTIYISGGPSQAGRVATLVFQGNSSFSKAKVQKFTGAAGQDLSSILAANFPSLIITAKHRFEGIACLLVTLEYDQDVYPQGIPQISAIMRGARVLDPRTGVTAWSENPALIARDWALYSTGGGASSDEVDAPMLNAAANACDVLHLFKTRNQDGTLTSTTRPMFTCGIALNTTADASQNFSAIVESMAGQWAWSGGRLRMRAGAYAAPVASIDESWLSGVGDIEIVGTAPRADRVNVITPTIYNASAGYTPAPQARVIAQAYVDVDGQELPQEMTFEGVTDVDHASHICGVLMREARQALTLKLPCKFKAYPLEVFDLVTVTLPRFGFAAKVFEVTATEMTQTGGVVLTLKETDPSIFDPDAEFTRQDPAPNTALPDPFTVPSLSIASVQSGTAQLLKQVDGTIVTRMLVTWAAIQDEAVRNGGAVEVTARRIGSDEQFTEKVFGFETQAYLQGVQDKQAYAVSIRARNKLVYGMPSVLVSHVVLGKSEAPAAVAGLTLSVVPGALRGARTPSAEADYAFTIWRYGPAFDGGSRVPGTSDANGFEWKWPPVGVVKIWAADVDASGNVGTPVSASITIDSAVLIGSSNITGGTNLTDLSWWKRDAVIPWATNGSEYNRLIAVAPGAGDLPIPGPKGGNDLCWYCEEIVHDGSQGGGWETAGTLMPLDPSKAYRFVVPIRRNTGTGQAYWGTHDVCALNTSTVDTNPYFASVNNLPTDRWFLFVGYVYPAGSTFNSHYSAGVWDCKTGLKVQAGNNWTFAASGGLIGHRAYQYYGSDGASHVFGRPMVNLVDGTEPSLREYFEAGAVLNDALVPSITAAQSAADAAATAAGHAQTDASGALSTLATMRSNGYLDAAEKPAVMRAYQAIYDESTGIYTAGTTYGLTALRNAYYAAFNALSTYLSGLSPSWSDTTVDTPITPAIDQATWAAYYSARQALLNAISDEAAKRAVWSQVGGAGKPADNATQNTITYGPTAPSSPIDGAIWIDSSVTPITIRMRLGGAWQYAGTFVNGTAQIVDDANLGLTALWSGIAGSGKPADSATRNQVFFQNGDPVTSPGGVVDGAIWISDTKAWQRVSGTWQPYVGASSIDTVQLVDSAATDVSVVTFTAISFSNIA